MLHPTRTDSDFFVCFYTLCSSQTGRLANRPLAQSYDRWLPSHQMSDVQITFEDLCVVVSAQTSLLVSPHPRDTEPVTAN